MSSKSEVVEVPVPKSPVNEHEQALQSLERRSVSVRSVYSQARMSMRRQSFQENPAFQAQRSSGRMSFKGAITAVSRASRNTLLTKKMVGVFIGLGFDAKEKARLAKEMEKLEAEAEEIMGGADGNGGDDGEGFQGKAVWLSSLLSEIEQLRAKSGSSGAEARKQSEELMANLKETMAKLEALKALYNDNRQDCTALKSQIDTLVKDVQSMLTVINESVKSLTTSVPSMCDTVVADIHANHEQLKELSNEESQNEEAQNKESHAQSNEQPDEQPHEQPNEQSSDSGPALSSSAPPEEESPDSNPTPITRGLWRKAAICFSFEKLFVEGTTKFLQDAVQEVSRTASQNGYEPLEALVVEDPPTDPPEASEAPTPQFSQTAPVKRGSLEQSLPDIAESSDMDMRHFEHSDAVDVEPDDTCQTFRSVPPMPLPPTTYPAIGERELVLPPCVQLLLQAGSPELERRLKCPYALLPLVPTRPRLPALRAKTVHRRRQASNLTLEAVLREREERGLRLADEND